MPTDIQSNTQTVKDTIALLVQQILGDSTPELVPLILPLINRGAASVLGDTGMGGLFSTNKTAEGLYQGRVNRRAAEMAAGASSAASSNFMRAVIDDMVRTTTSEQTWKGRSLKNRLKGHKGYEDFVQQEVQGWMQKPLAGVMFNAINGRWDIGGYYSAAASLQGTAFNLASHGLQQPNYRQKILGGYQLATNLFTGDWDEKKGDFDNKKKYKASEWGGQHISATAKIAETLSKDTDFLGNIDTSNTGKLQQAVRHFRDTVKEYANALAPLKDVFGNDAEQMIDLLQNITGTSLGQIPAIKAARLSEAVASRVNSGQFSVADIQLSTARMTERLSQLSGLGTFNYLAGAEQGIAALDIAAGGRFRPDYRTNSQFQAMAQNLVTETYNSKASDLIAKSYALWAHRNQGIEGGTSFEAFEKRVTEEAESGEDVRRIAFRLSGATTASDLDEAYAYKEYRQAIESGNAGALGMSGYVGAQLRRGQRRAAAKEGFRNAVAGGDSHLAGLRYGSVIRLIESRPDLVKMSDEERSQFLVEHGENLGVDWFKADGTTSTSFNKEDAESVNRAITYMKGDTVLAKTLDIVGARANLKEQKEMQQRTEKRRVALRTVDKQISDNADGIYSMFKDGFSMEKFKQRLNLENLTELEGADLEEVGSLLDVATTQGKQYYKKDEKSANALASRIYQYAMSTEGMANRGFNEALRQYQGLSKEDKEGDKGKALRERIQAYTEVDKGVMDKFYSMDVYDKKGNKLEGAKAEEKRQQMLSDILKTAHSGKKNAQSTSDAIRWTMVDSQLQGLEAGKQKEVEKVLKEYKKEADKGSDNILQVGENFNEFYAAKKEKIEKSKDSEAVKQEKLDALDKVKELVGAAESGKAVPELLKDILGLLEQLVRDYRSRKK